MTFIFFSSTPMTFAETVLLAQCPSEPDVVGTYYNNGDVCVRDRVEWEREIVDASCPTNDETNAPDDDPGKDDDKGNDKGKDKNRHRHGPKDATWHYASGWCRRRGYKHVRPTCPSGYQRFGNKCHKQCPSTAYQQKHQHCLLPRHTLPSKYMTCPDETQHRYDAYCCVPGVDCPRWQCNVGMNVPGKFFYDTETGLCERQVETISRVSASKPRPTTGNASPSCPPGKEQVWGRCQDPCPYGFRPLQGKCELQACIFDPMVDTFLECPEGTYKVAKAIF